VRGRGGQKNVEAARPLRTFEKTSTNTAAQQYLGSGTGFRLEDSLREKLIRATLFSRSKSYKKEF